MYKLISAAILILAGYMLFSSGSRIACRGCRRRIMRKAVKAWLCLAVILWAAVYAFAFELPDSVNEWQCVNEHITPLVPAATSADLGRVVYRDYAREAPRGFVQVIMTDGTGTGSLYVPEKAGDSKGDLPTEAAYKLLNVAGYKAVFEKYPLMPLSLAVDAGKDIIITVESSYLSEDEIIKFTEDLLLGCNFQ